MGATGKSIRDGGIAGGIAVLVSTVLVEQFDVPSGVAIALGPMAGAVAARAYRMLRARWPWLLNLDPPGGSEGTSSPPPAPPVEVRP